MSKSIPDRWIPYKACGKVIDGTRIICFKVPLKKAVQVKQALIKEIWDINALLKKIPNLGAVIDLTNTYRYYDPRELQAQGVLHKKILMPGRIIPPESKVKEFMDAVDEFLGKDCETLLGVHCTHGLNRTGYMVCRYMRDRLGIPANDAIKKFQKARGYQIERENYIADLLGKKTLPPNNETVIRPVTDNMVYRSPLDDRVEEQEVYNNYSRQRKRGNGYNYRNRYNDGREDSCDWISKSSWRQNHKRHRSNFDRSYNYKYDY